MMDGGCLQHCVLHIKVAVLIRDLKPDKGLPLEIVCRVLLEV